MCACASAHQVFEAFVQLYGGGPEIVRNSFDIYSTSEENTEAQTGVEMKEKNSAQVLR